MKTPSRIHLMAECAIFAALLCIFGPVSVPIGPVPISLTNLIVCLAIVVLGSKRSTISVLVFLLLGGFGLPVFSGGAGGLAKLAGPTGGYLIGYIFLCLLAGWLIEKASFKLVAVIPALILGTAVLYAFGTAWFCFVAKAELGYALSVCVYPFILVDLIKIVLAALVGGQVRKALVKASLI